MGHLWGHEPLRHDRLLAIFPLQRRILREQTQRRARRADRSREGLRRSRHRTSSDTEEGTATSPEPHSVSLLPSPSRILAAAIDVDKAAHSQQAFRARKEKLVRGLSHELANLQCQYASTKAENERLGNDLRLAQTELSAIRSVLQHQSSAPARESAVVPATSGLAAAQCSVVADPSSCTLTLKINIDSLMGDRARQGYLATPPTSAKDEECLDMRLEPLGEPLRYG